LQEIISKSIISPVIQALNAEGNPYKGILYAGLILTKEGPKVLEFNCRFGDPETQVLLQRLETDLLQIILSINAANLNETKVEWNDNHSVAVVLASSGYPNVFQTGYQISGLEDLDKSINIFHSGTKKVQGKFVTNGGRVLTLTAICNDLASASSLIYSNIDKVNFEGAYYRHDIGK
jgi:phosphoribosylamine--glycine ligase